MSDDTLSAVTAAALAKVAGIPLADNDAAARIAAGANAAIMAVRSVANETCFDYEPSDYLAALEELAEPDVSPR
jgi:hypothetical protein